MILHICMKYVLFFQLLPFCLLCLMLKVCFASLEYFLLFFFRIYCYSGITVVVKVFIKDTPSDIPTFYMLTHSYFRGCKFDDRPTVVRDQS